MGKQDATAPLNPEDNRGQAFEVALSAAPVAFVRTTSPGAASASSLVQAGVLSFYVVTRAVHPLIMDVTKEVGRDGKKDFPYDKISLPLASAFLVLLLSQGLTLLNGGVREWRATWQPRPMAVFCGIGVFYGVSDYLELRAMNSLSGPVYQVLSQSKMVITAMMLWAIKGQKQSFLQWVLLILLMFCLVSYMIMKDLLEKHRDTLAGRPQQTGDSDDMMMEGLLAVVGKIAVSCLCSVLSDKYIKDFSDEPIYMQLGRMMLAAFFTLLVLVAIDADEETRERGLLGVFHSWNLATFAGLTSFAVKFWSGMYLIAILDSLAKNIGEACAVLLTYFCVIMHPNFDDEYENETFVTVLLVFLSGVAYLSAKSVVAKARRYDRQQGTLGV